MGVRVIWAEFRRGFQSSGQDDGPRSLISRSRERHGCLVVRHRLLRFASAKASHSFQLPRFDTSALEQTASLGELGISLLIIPSKPTRILPDRIRQLRSGIRYVTWAPCQATRRAWKISRPELNARPWIRVSFMASPAFLYKQY